MSFAPWQVMPCPPPLRPAAVRLLHDGLPSDQRTGLAEALSKVVGQDDPLWNGLIVAWPRSAAVDELRMAGAAWVQRMPGNTAVLWPPSAESLAGESLLLSAAAFIDEQRLPLAQFLVGEGDGRDAAMLERCGFTKLADLAYLYAEASAGTAAVTADDAVIEFVPGAGREPERLGKVIERTYLKTLDCAGLDGVRPMSEVLEGYRAQGNYSPDQWYFVKSRAMDVGVLLLTAHAQTGNWELVYMGVSPEGRGRGLGRRIARFAIEAAARGGGERVVLAVDAANGPALGVYRDVGFLEWDRRTVYARIGARLHNA